MVHVKMGNAATATMIVVLHTVIHQVRAKKTLAKKILDLEMNQTQTGDLRLLLQVWISLLI